MRFLINILATFTFIDFSHGFNVKLASSCVINKYSEYLSIHPKLTNIVTASALCILSDTVAQSIERNSKNVSNNTNHSYYRSFFMGIYGAFVFGHFVIFWYRFLNYLIPSEGITPNKIFQKVLINQICMSPSLNTFFFGYVILTRDFTSSLSQKFINFKEKLQVDLLPTIKRSFLYWGIVQYVNFGMIPPKFSVVYTNIAFTLWTVYLSLVGYRRVKIKT